jgi:murein DD-endopeptidase MepM/ murein hydrolase activator NlpD
MPVRLRVLLAGIAIPLALWAMLPVLSNASLEGKRSDIEKTIKRKNRVIERQKGREQRLSGQIDRFDTRIGSLQTRIDGLQSRENVLQEDLDVKLGELGAIQEDLKSQRARLVRLRARLATGRRVLAERLIELYKADDPDVMTVILNSNGFADLLERSEFIGRVGRQDQKIITRVTTYKAETTATTKKLGKLEDRQKAVVGIIAARRNQVAAVREDVTSQRDNFADARSERQDLLGGVRSDRVDNQEDVQALARESDRITQRLSGSSGSTGGTAGPIRSGGGGLIWPVNGPITSPFCERRAWEACHPGIDIGVGAGTPIRAAAAGKVVLAGPNGGYGNYTCIQHAGPLQTCYAHQSAIQVSVGQSVSQGQVIGLVGCTGLCFGDHLHFETRINGSVVNPMNYLG